MPHDGQRNRRVVFLLRLPIPRGRPTTFGRGVTPFDVSEPPLPDFPHSEPQGNIHTQVAMEALEVGEFRGQIHRATIATRPQEPSRTLQTVALSATPPLPPFSADRVY